MQPDRFPQTPPKDRDHQDMSPRSPSSAYPSPAPTTRTPLYDDPNHLAYGWQQMSTIPDFPGMFALMTRGSGPPPPGGQVQEGQAGEGGRSSEMREGGRGFCSRRGFEARSLGRGDGLCRSSCRTGPRRSSWGRKCGLEVGGDSTRLCAVGEEARRDMYKGVSMAGPDLIRKTSYPRADVTSQQSEVSEESRKREGSECDGIRDTVNMRDMTVEDDAREMEKITSALKDCRIHRPASQPASSKHICAGLKPLESAAVEQTDHHLQKPLRCADGDPTSSDRNPLSKEAEISTARVESEFEIIEKLSGGKTARNGSGLGRRWGLRFRRR